MEAQPTCAWGRERTHCQHAVGARQVVWRTVVLRLGEKVPSGARPLRNLAIQIGQQG